MSLSAEQISGWGFNKILININNKIWDNYHTKKHSVLLDTVMLHVTADSFFWDSFKIKSPIWAKSDF